MLVEYCQKERDYNLEGSSRDARGHGPLLVLQSSAWIGHFPVIVAMPAGRANDGRK